jgi:glycosyltransferase involved in cell wall biosynthesis
MTIAISAPVSGKSVTCGIADYLQSLSDALHGQEAVDFHVDRVETANPISFVAAIVGRLRADGVVHFNLPVEGWGNSLLPGIALFLARLFTRRGKIVLTLHEWLSLNRLRFLSLLPDVWSADQIVLVSRQQWEAFKASPSAPRRLRENAALIPIGPNIKATMVNLPLRKRMDRNELVIGHFGVLYASKQPEVMLRTVAELNKRGVRTRLLLCGDFLPDKPQDKDCFFQAARELGVLDQIDFRGRIEDGSAVLVALAEADVHLLLYSDGASARRSSLLACLQLDLPIVTTSPERADEFQDWPDIERQLSDGSIRCVAPDASEETIADAVQAIVAEHPMREPINAARIWKRTATEHVRLYARVTEAFSGTDRERQA